MEIKDVLKNFREENKISQREFSRRSGLSNSLISILEMGVNPQTGKKIKPDIETYIKIADGMGIQLSELLEMIKDSDESISLLPYSRKEQELPWEECIPKTEESRIISGSIDRMPPEDRERALAILKAAYADYFDKPEDKMA